MFGRVAAGLLPLVPRRIVGRVARRYIAGETSDEAIELAAELAAAGYVTTLDILGEDATSREQAAEAADAYVALIGQLRSGEGGATRNVSLKLSQLGLRVDPGVAFDQLRRILDAAADSDTFVRIDMEDASVTDQTLDIYRRAREHWPRVGTVLQARLKRTEDDARQLAAEGANLRLCKGIYLEPRGIAFRRVRAIRRAFQRVADLLLAGRGHVAFATHDHRLVANLKQQIRQHRPDGEGVEFQALLGVPVEPMVRSLRDERYPVRIYVPFGEQWYAYSVRRLRENPKMAGAVLRGLLRRRKSLTEGASGRYVA